MTALPAHLERVHMVGIGGAGMSGIARILLSRGGLVSGSDAKESRGVLALRARGAQVRIGHDADALDLLPGGPTVVVTTHAAIPKDNPELVEAARRGIPVILRPAVLASLMQGNRTFLVSGTHGKTSTTSMLVVALQHCGFDPSFAVGGELNEAGTNAHHGSGDVFVAEADESDGSLLQYDPNVIVVTNIEADHLDYFGSVEAYVKVFDDFVDKLRPGGLLIACLDDPGSADLAKRIVASGRSDIRVLGYGSADAQEVEAGTAFEPVHGVEVGVRLLGFHAHDVGGVLQFHLAGESAARTVRMAVPGRHMALNALAALLAARDAGAETEEIVEGLAGFGGVHRRFQFTGRERGVRVFDDYAHHPTEVRAVLGAAADLVRPEGRFVVDQFGSRTRDRGLPTSSLFTHRRVCRGVRAGAGLGRRGCRSRCLRRSRRADAGRQWCAGRSVGHETCSLSTGSVTGAEAGGGVGSPRRHRHHDGCR